MPQNLLADATSPYLLQHADNPVAWEPWGEASIARARREGRPIFLSVGYSACHWCHVMAHESFESEAIAARLNEHFVNVKVDREERPDLDAVYMQAVQLLTGRGGWPMSVFLTPDLEPFFAGTYWPPEPRMGMPGFPQVIAAVADAWANRREQVLRQAAEITQALRDAAASRLGDAPQAGIAIPTPHGPAAEELLASAAASLARAFDHVHGGFGAAPKFPHPMDLRLLLRGFARTGQTHLLEMATMSLEKMALGGIHDQLGGGFSRYSVDARWLVPHFEKMLYDNALLAIAALEAFLVTGREEFAGIVRSTLDYLLRDMADPAGGIHAAEDADSEGEEGKFYVWSPEEILATLGDDDGRLFCEVYDVSPEGNFEGHSILNLRRSLAAEAKLRGAEPADFARRLAAMREKLLAVRSRRVRPGVDDKVLVAWNGLAIDALARAGAALDEPRYTQAALRAAGFLLGECRDGSGRLAHQWRRGKASGLAFAEDLACLAEGLVSLYEATFDERWLVEACRLADMLLGVPAAGTGGPAGAGGERGTGVYQGGHPTDPRGEGGPGNTGGDGGPATADAGFLDPETGGFFQTSAAHEKLLVREPDLLDNATPSATGMAATVLARLAALTGRSRYRTAAERAVAAAVSIAARAPQAVSQSLIALDALAGPFEESVIVGDVASDAGRTLLAELRRTFRPRGVVAARPVPAAASDDASPLDPLFTGRRGTPGKVTLYACRGGVCTEPVVR